MLQKIKKTSSRFEPRGVRNAGRLLFTQQDLPAEMPVPRGSYILVAILSGTNWQFGQLIPNKGFYQELKARAEEGRQFKIDLYSIHSTRLASLPRSRHFAEATLS